MPTPSATLETRQTLAKASALVDTFQNRQRETLTAFETLCARQTQSNRSLVANILSTWADDAAEGGISALYKKKAVDSLAECLSRFSFWGHIFHKVPGTTKQAVAITMSYCLSSKADRKKIKKNIESGYIMDRPILTKKESSDFKKRSTESLGQSLYELQINMQQSYSIFNIPNQLSHRTEAEKEAIESDLRATSRQMDYEDISIGINQMTQDLVPFFFKESRPMAIRSHGLAFSTALYGRISWGNNNTQTIDRVQSVLNLTKTFSFLFLTMPAWKQEGMIRHLYPKKQKATIQQFFRMAAKSDCHCHV